MYAHQYYSAQGNKIITLYETKCMYIKIKLNEKKNLVTY